MVKHPLNVACVDTSYTKKTKKEHLRWNEMYKLIWKGEVIEEEIETLTEAKYLQGEYTMAYGGSVSIKKN